MPVIDCQPLNSLLTPFDAWPPFLIKALALHNGRCITQKELCSRTGWSHTKLKHITSRVSWEHVPVGDMLILMQACRFSWIRRVELHRRLKELMRTKFRHMQLSQNSLLPRFLKKMDSLDANHPTRKTWERALAKLNQERLQG